MLIQWDLPRVNFAVMVNSISGIQLQRVNSTHVPVHVHVMYMSLFCPIGVWRPPSDIKNLPLPPSGNKCQFPYCLDGLFCPSGTEIRLHLHSEKINSACNLCAPCVVCLASPDVCFIRPVQSTAVKFCLGFLFFAFFLFQCPNGYPYLNRFTTTVHWPPMNKFACKLHGYIVYFDSMIVMKWLTFLLSYHCW